MGDFIIRDNKRKEYYQFTTRLEVDLLEELRVVSANNNISLNSLINDCIRYALSKLETKE